MNLEPLDRPVWNALCGAQAGLGMGSAAAMRLDPRYGPFAAARDASDESLAGLAGLLRGPDDGIVVLESEAWPAPPGTRVVLTMDLVQMVCLAPPAAVHHGAELLAEGDAPAMRALAAAAEPGPWAEWTHRFGTYFGARQGADLLAMAGERLRPASGLAELSGVATAEAARGMGHGERVVRAVIASHAARGDITFLHCRADNAGAIRLYERLGFTLRRRMVVTVFASD